MSKTTVFISYSHKDEEWKNLLVKELKVLQIEGILNVWDDRQIEIGDDWLPSITTAIEQSSVAVLIISSNFLTSEFILGKEVPSLLSRRHAGNLRIMPLIVEPSSWQSVGWLKGIQSHPIDGKALSGGSDHQIKTEIVQFANSIQRLIKKSIEHQGPKYILPDNIDISKLPLTNPEVFGRKTKLKFLNKSWKNPTKKIVCFVGWGGVGKSALINTWLNVMSDSNYHGAELIYGWSFYSQGASDTAQASADSFFNEAYRWFGYENEIPQEAREKGRKLAEIISKRRTLLILDGFEPLQHPPGEQYGRLKDEAMVVFIRILASIINGLCIISSRCKVEDLIVTEGRATITQPLGRLSENAGMAVLKSYNLTGDDVEFINTSREFKGHALALHLVGSYLHAYHQGDLRKRNLIPNLTEDEKHGGHARRVMQSYEMWFADNNQAELDVLNLLGLFDRPADKSAIEVLKQNPPIKGLTERLQYMNDVQWQNTLNHLRKLRLIADEDDNHPQTIDCHPLIREHFGEKFRKLNPSSWEIAHLRLYEYYKKLPDIELPDTLAEMEPLFSAIRHGCLGGMDSEAINDVYKKRIIRDSKAYINTKLRAFNSDLACLSNFFEIPWSRPSQKLIDSDKANLFNWAGYALQAVGRLSEAVQPMKLSLKMFFDQGNLKDSALAASNLNELYRSMGKLKTALDYGRQSVDLAVRSGNSEELEIDKSLLANTIHQTGNLGEAEDLFREAEQLLIDRKTDTPIIHSLQGFHYCDLLLSLGKIEEVLNRSNKTLKMAIEKDRMLDIALDQLTLSKAIMHQAFNDDSHTFSLSEMYINKAIEGLRSAKNQDRIPLGLLARAALYRHQEKFASSWVDCDEAREIAGYGQMNLHLTDYHLEASRILLSQLTDVKNPASVYQIIDEGESKNLSAKQMELRFVRHFEDAKRLITTCGYHRRDVELETLNKHYIEFLKN